MIKNNITKISGYIIIINVLLFMTVSVIILSGVINPILSHYVSAKGFTDSKKSFQLANSATEEVMYRLRKNKNLSSSASITLSSGTANISIASNNKTKTVTINSVSNSYERNILLNIVENVGVSFAYGMQAGKGGITMQNNSYVQGNVYSNGNIIGGNNSYITGSATVANAVDPVANQTNGTTIPPTSSVNFGGPTAPQDFSQSFQVSTTTAVTSVRLYIKKNTNLSLSDVSVKIVTNGTSQPHRTVLTSGSLASALVTTSYNYVSIPFSTNVSLAPGTTYWLVLDANTSSNANYFSIATSLNTYNNGLGKIGTWSSSGSGGTWSDTSPSGQDAYFDLYVGGVHGLITGLDRIGTGTVGDAWAHEVKNISSIRGSLYCQVYSNIGGGKVCDTSREDPVEQPFPISDGNIQDWKDTAITGGTLNGNQTYSSGTSYIGAKKIAGNLTITNATLVITGTLHVTGNINLSNNSEIKLDPAYGSGSGIVVADGTITIENNGKLNGSGSSGSYILIVSTSACPVSGSCGSGDRAIQIDNNAVGSAILNAQNGTLKLSNNASVKEATAYKIELDNNAAVTYETGVANANFVSGPSGSWYISSWDEQ